MYYIYFEYFSESRINKVEKHSVLIPSLFVKLKAFFETIAFL